MDSDRTRIYGHTNRILYHWYFQRRSLKNYCTMWNKYFTEISKRDVTDTLQLSIIDESQRKIDASSKAIWTLQIII
jgi:hypothetical protein